MTFITQFDSDLDLEQITVNFPTLKYRFTTCNNGSPVYPSIWGIFHKNKTKLVLFEDGRVVVLLRNAVALNFNRL